MLLSDLFIPSIMADLLNLFVEYEKFQKTF